MARKRPKGVLELGWACVESGLRIEQVGDAHRKLGRTGRRILKLEKLTREPAEIVDRPRPFHGGNGDARDIPVSGDAEDAVGPRDGSS